MKKSELKNFISEEIRRLTEDKKTEYRNTAYALGKFLKKKFPKVKFTWDEDAKGWWTTDENFVDNYSEERANYNPKKAKALKSKVKDLVIDGDFDSVLITLD